MGYRRMTLQDLKTIHRRWKDGQSLSRIEVAEGITRKTIRRYIQLFQDQHWKDPPTDIQLAALLTTPARSSKTRDELEPISDEIRKYIEGDKDAKMEPVKAKTAYLIVREKYGLTISYESFKIFAREKGFSHRKVKPTVRIETPPGEEIQIDYGRVGSLYDHDTGRNRVVHAFGGILSHSRLPFVQYVYSMDSESFIRCHVDMFEFYGGVTQYLTIDNLKTGVLKPDLYDPVLNRAYAEMAEHYSTFINPCRVADPKGKGKIERIVPTLRELFRRLKALNPDAALKQINKEALKLCVSELGMKEHGTTGEAPYLKFRQEEQKTLKPLQDPFVIPHWKDALVGLDQFLQFERRLFALPVQFIRKKVQVCRTGKQVKIFYQNELVRQYVLDGSKKYFYSQDFPEGLGAIVEGSYPAWLIKKAGTYGKAAQELVEQTLHPQAALNARRARGLLTVMETFCSLPDFQERCASAVKKRITTPSAFKKHLQLNEQELKPIGNLSPRGRQMARDCDYYFS